MNQLVLAPPLCNRCHSQRDVGDNFCRICGSNVADTAFVQADLVAVHPAELPAIQQDSVSPVRELLDNRAIVVGILLCVGPIGLPALWLNRRFSSTTKIITTVLYFLATVVLPLILAWYWLEIAIRPLADLFVQRP